MKEYIDIIHKQIEESVYELRGKVAESNDSNLQKVLDEYEKAYYESCLKIEELIDNELAYQDLNSKD